MVWLSLLCFVTFIFAPPLETSTDDSPDFEKALRAAVAGGDEEAIATAIGGLAGEGGESAISLICRVGSHYPGDPVRSAVSNALARRGDREWAALLASEYDAARNWKIALVALEGLIAGACTEAVGPLIDALESTERVMVLTAVRGLGRIPDRRAIEPLIERVCSLQERQDALWAEVRVTLGTLTNRSYHECDDWRKWLLTLPPGWQPGADGNPLGKTSVDRSGGDGVPTVFGQEVTSTRVVFLLDTSSSMKEKDPGARESASQPRSRVRMERAKAELIKVIDKLRPEVYFDIIGYSTDVSSFKGKLVPAKGVRRKQAINWISDLKPHGYTSTGDALESALAIEGVDTIILLSDGTPTHPYTGKRVRVSPIIEMVRRQNRFLKVTIHTLGFRGANEAFMKQLAHDSGGIYDPIR